jgi:tRNA U34 5-methylaminomethyl-2-thiouridine-forming methyltransferase MnmC
VNLCSASLDTLSGEREKMSNREGHGLSWDAGDVPVSELFDDTFYSRQDGQAESAYVFVDGNGLPVRWALQPHFSIAELGFGTGLNFLETWRIWVKTRRPGQKLSFTSFERFALSVDDMARALGAWPSLNGLAGELLARWSSGERGACWQMDAFTELRVVIGDAEAAVGSWEGVAQAWYLDGFSPAKNPEMWSAPLMRAVFERTAPGGGFATYTAAGWVRRNLEEAGFEVHKRPGHAGKREMMFGEKPAS